ncbi:serine hydrolase [Rhodococcus sp. NCIMB 12038]|uniref:serine hydrolase domain-containing protein n=1 Tax=Rhodococcus sp. NCIMB 12038 TaxID=933800 RepID=UPI000B3C1A22|nr:serine hydrolase domain-containing protein [Rhodococcus sp. NCIMB 12038]OUS84151.1 1,4-butanediol diacrylate esterase [Rhodococcus sp. NCIMB 12038]
MSDLDAALGKVLDDVTADGAPRVPGVVAMLTDRDRTVFEGAAGVRSVADGEPMTTDTVFAIFSTTKAITGTSVLQCAEEGLLDLDAPAREYVPELGDIQVIEGFDDHGDPVLRAPKRDITTRMLLLHTAGFGYAFFDETYNRLGVEHDQPSVITASRASLKTPLLFDPGTKWQYGTNIDWAGQVVEAIRGKRLGEVMAERVFAPLGMHDTSFALSGSMAARRATIHQREEDGRLTPLDLVLPQDPEIHMGGHGLYSTVGDYLKFLRMWLNDGDAPGGRVLRADTVQAAVCNGLEGQEVGMLPAVIPALTNDAEFFPGQRKSWAYTFMVNEEDAPTGRPKGSLGWAGLANSYYWIDRRTGIAGYWATQILPFADPVSFGGYLDFETTAYRHAPVASPVQVG